MSLAVLMFAMVGCGASQQGKAPSTVTETTEITRTTTTASSVGQPGQKQAPQAQDLLPEECDFTSLMVISEDETMVQCACRTSQTEAQWTSVKSKDPAWKDHQCLAGLHYEWQITRLPIRGPRAVDVLAGTTSQAAPAKPTKVQPAATNAVPVQVAPVASASQVVLTTEQESRIRILYECRSGEVAKRILTAKASGDKEGREIQTCAGKSLICLDDKSAKQDFSVPPCTCKGGKAPRQSFGTVWMCD